MNKIDHLNSRFRQIGYQPKSATIAFNLLAQTLKQSEVVLYLVEGSVQNTLGYLIATDRRIFYAGIDKHKKPMMEFINYEEIDSIEDQDTVFPSIDIVITSKNGNQVKIKGCEPEDGSKFVTLIKYLSQAA